MVRQDHFIKNRVSLSINGIYNEPLISKFTVSVYEGELEDNYGMQQLKLRLYHMKA